MDNFAWPHEGKELGGAEVTETVLKNCAEHRIERGLIQKNVEKKQDNHMKWVEHEEQTSLKQQENWYHHIHIIIPIQSYFHEENSAAAAAQQPQLSTSNPAEADGAKDEPGAEENNSQHASNSVVSDQVKNFAPEGDKFNGFSPTTGPLSIPYFKEQEPQDQNKPFSSSSLKPCISSSNPDREPLGHAFHHVHTNMYSNCGLAVCGGGAGNTGAHKRTSIVSSAGLIAAELTPPHRPLRRSLGELPWSSHALLLTHIEDTTPHPQPPPPPPRANRSVVLATTTEPTQSPKTSADASSSNGPRSSS
ncbi:unnamed protein product [Rodentolepis nana]|uniref:Uncharacterized protein n=1 Tax=Rodentolepis nana TaxID=102285 RepID=A0A0R3TS11_RODNA|nr:unnamed protein product [Rodentolepis nana]